MRNYIEEKDWSGPAENLAKKAEYWMRRKSIGDPAFEPNVRLVRDYVARGILTKPERRGKEALFGFEQLTQFLACRAMIAAGWPLSKISEEFQISSIGDILKLVPGEPGENEALSLVETFKADLDAGNETDSKVYAMDYIANESAEKGNGDQDFRKRSRGHYESQIDIKTVLNRLGSDFGNVIREDFTAYQLASWLVLLVDRDRASGITRDDAEDIGRGITAALLNRNSLTKADRSIYTAQMKALSSLDDEVRSRERDLRRAKAEIERLEKEIAQRRSELDEKDKKPPNGGK